MAVYPERESNPHGHRCPRDFKSRVSTYSTTKAAVAGFSKTIPVIPTRLQDCKDSKYICKNGKEVLN